LTRRMWCLYCSSISLALCMVYLPCHWDRCMVYCRFYQWPLTRFAPSCCLLLMQTDRRSIPYMLVGVIYMYNL
jgi:hypothetical protein